MRKGGPVSSSATKYRFFTLHPSSATIFCTHLLNDPVAFRQHQQIPGSDSRGISPFRGRAAHETKMMQSVLLYNEPLALGLKTA